MKESFAKIVWHNLLTLILLNLAFIAACLPLITVPAAAVGLYKGVYCCLRGKSKAMAEFWKAFRGSLFSALPVGLFFVAVMSAAAYGCIFYRMNYSGRFILLPVSVFCLLVLYLSYAAMTYAFTMLAAVELPVKKLIKNAFLLLLADAKNLFSWPALSAAIMLFSILLFPRSLAVMMLLSFSAAAVTGARGAMPLIDLYIKEENNE